MTRGYSPRTTLRLPLETCDQCDGDVWATDQDGRRYCLDHANQWLDLEIAYHATWHRSEPRCSCGDCAYCLWRPKGREAA